MLGRLYGLSGLWESDAGSAPRELQRIGPGSLDGTEAKAAFWMGQRMVSLARGKSKIQPDLQSSEAEQTTMMR
jgi:hypothetical protein